MRKIMFLPLARKSLIVISLLGIGAYFLTSAHKQEDPFVEVQPVEKGDIVESITAPARLVARTQGEIRSSKPISLSELFVKRGDRVQKGQPLARLHSADAVEETRGLLLMAQMEERQAEKGLKATRELFAAKAVPKRQVEESEVRATRATLARDQAERAFLHSISFLGLSADAVLAGKPLIISAPIDGMITQANLRTEATTNSEGRGKPLFLIVDPTSPLIVADLNPIDLNKVQVDQSVTFTLPFGSITLVGTVIDIAPEVSQSDIGSFSGPGREAPPVRVTSRVTSPLPEKGVAFGMMGEASITVAQRKGVTLITHDAVLSKRGKRWVMVLEQGRAARREVQLGISDQEKIEVVKGLKAGEQVMVRGHALLVDGQPVRVGGERLDEQS